MDYNPHSSICQVSMFHHGGVKQSSLHWEAILQTAGSPGGEGAGRPLLLGDSSPSMTWMKHRKLCQDPPSLCFKHPLLFYNPLLLSLCLCVVLKGPVNAPPTPNPPLLRRQWWSAGETQFSSLLLISPPLIFSTEEWGVSRSSSSQAFLLF